MIKKQKQQTPRSQLLAMPKIDHSSPILSVLLRLENKLAETNHIYYFSENEDLITGINDFVKERKADMIVTIPHRHSLLERLFHESNSKKIAFHTAIPLLTLPDNHKSVAAYFL